MKDHESFLLLAAKQISERLSEEEEAALTDHIASCPSCRATMNAMRRDDILLRGELAATSVSPRVRRRVLEEAAGVRRFDWRVPLAIAATLLVAAAGVPLLVGGWRIEFCFPGTDAGVGRSVGVACSPVSERIRSARAVRIAFDLTSRCRIPRRRSLRLRRDTAETRHDRRSIRGRTPGRRVVASRAGRRRGDLLRRSHHMPDHRWP